MKPHHDLGAAVDLFLGDLARRGRTKSTRRKYRDVLEPFADLYQHKTPGEITHDDCGRYLDRWIDASESTLALYVTVVRRFFDFCEDHGYVAASPAAKLKRPRRKRPEDLDVVTVGAEDVGLLFAACEEWDDLLCLAVLGYLGPRRTAAARARRGDVDLQRRTIRFLEKGRKVAVKTIPDELAAIIRAADENNVWTGPSDYLIPNRRPPRRKKERSAKVVYAIVKRVSSRAGVTVHPHALRAAFAVQFDEQHPGEIWALKELLGHARIETTLVYLRRKDRAKAIEAVRDLSWGATVFPPRAVMPPAGFEPAFGEQPPQSPVFQKLEELRARSSRGVRS